MTALVRKSGFALASLAAFLLLAGLAAAPAGAVPGAYRAIVVQANCQPPTKLRGELDAIADVAVVDEFDACVATPSAQQLSGYDLVVSMSKVVYADQVSYGNALADYVDRGGVVVQFAYDNWDDDFPNDPNGPTGRFASGGYEPFLPAANPSDHLTLGTFDASSPLMQGVAALASEHNTRPTLSQGATLVAKWSDDANLVAYKGNVVSVSAYVGDDSTWSGDFARLIVNAIRWLGAQTLTLENFTPGGGSLSVSPTGTPCPANNPFVCSAYFQRGTQVTVSATPTKGFAFSGFFNGDCIGPSCVLTMSSGKTVRANFVRFAPKGKLTRNLTKGTAVLTIRVGGAGRLALAGKRVKVQSRSLTTDANLKIPLIAKGKAAKKLKKTGKAKVGFKVTYTPNAGAATSFDKTVVLRKTVEP